MAKNNSNLTICQPKKALLLDSQNDRAVPTQTNTGEEHNRMELSSSAPTQNQKGTTDHEEEVVFGEESEDSIPQTHPTEEQPEMTAAEKEKYDRIRSVCFDRASFSYV